MIYLLLAILCSASIGLILKYSENNNLNRYAVTCTNYVTAFTVSLVIALGKGLFRVDYGTLFPSFQAEFPKVFLQNQGIFTEAPTFLWAVMTGIVAGVFYLASLMYYQKNVRENGVGLSGAFGKMGDLIPILLTILLWQELPGVFQWLGILLALSSILIISLSFEGTVKYRINHALLLLLALNGMASFSNKFFQKYAVIEYKEVYLFFVFFTAFILSLILALRNNRKVSGKDLIVGFAIGIPNLFTSYFLILALNQLYSFIVFPIFSALSIVVINLGGIFIFKEKLKKQEVVSILLIIGALVLVNI